MTDILVIGARTLVGRRLRDLAPDATFTSRRDLAGNSLYLDLEKPTDFRPQRAFSQVIVTAPVWLVSDELLQHLLSLGMRRLVVFSSTSVFTKEVSDEPAEREVVQRLLAGEKTVTDFCAATGVAGTILRPTLIYDEGLDDNVSRIRNLIEKLGFFPVCGPASGLRQPVHACDLATAALQALAAEAAFGKSYNLSGGDTLSYRDMVARVFTATGRKPAVVPLPEGIWRLGFAVLHLIRPGQALKQNLAMAQRMNKDLWFDHAAAMRDFGYAPGPFRPDFTGGI
ncbi:NAD-dependent epimerase/dehydratase family protein [Asticcacaulis sp. AC460]|uniref:NAD-dependent epimerase/dehydratase family protein n=1 Tax=Asticcacaulis sp. AC460 TaxID=1282360 RepID=UPI001F3959C5|nr:NAD-dependent epimerase/dehydratase family protein [Asticcacaulis sp. AC460]